MVVNLGWQMVNLIWVGEWFMGFYGESVVNGDATHGLVVEWCNSWVGQWLKIWVKPWVYG